MNPNPAFGVFFHWLGGLASGSFYVPYRAVKRLVLGNLLAGRRRIQLDHRPWLLAATADQQLLPVLSATPFSTLFWCYFFGLLWGVGGLTFGLTMRYLGLSLGMAIVMGLCAAFGTIMPPIFNGSLSRKYSAQRQAE